MMHLILCPACGYKIMIMSGEEITPGDIRATRKLAERQKFHFSSKSYESCPRPQCGYNFKDTEGDITSTNISEPGGQEQLEKALDRITAGSIIIRSLRDTITRLTKVAESFPSASPLLDQIAQAKSADIDISLQLKDLVATVQLLGERANAFADEIVKASK